MKRDAQSERIKSGYGDGSSTSFTYDSVNRLLQVYDSNSGLIQMGYDDLDRLTQELTPQGAVNYSYDSIGRRTSMTANGLAPVNYQYDNASRLTQVAQGSNAVNLGYDNAGRRTSLTYPNGTATNYFYDNASRLNEILHQGPSGTIEDLSYAYDAAGNRISFNRTDSQAELPQAVQAAYNAANQMIHFNTDTLTYDANGNLTFDGTTTYTWDGRNRLSQMSNANVSASFVYDSLGRRVSKTINGATTKYLYDGNDVIAEIQYGAISATYLRSLNVDEPFLRASSVAEYYHTDALGSTLALTDQTGTVQTTYSYDPFGNTTIAGSSTNPFQYTGRENDGTGLYFNRARYLNIMLQRFINEDPLGFAGGNSNLYAYVFNSPINYIDLLGLYTQQELTAIIYNESAALSGPGIFDVRVDIGHIAVNRETAGMIGGIAPKTLSDSELSALQNGVPAVQEAYGQAIVAATLALGERKDPTQGATEFNFRPNSSLRPRTSTGTPVLINIGPLNNNDPTIGNPKVPLSEQLPAIGVYFNVYGVPKP
jgi:RHS repeat-associated protein